MLLARPSSTSRLRAGSERPRSKARRASPTARSTSTRRTCACGNARRRRLADTSLTLDASGKAGDGTLAIDGRFGWRGRRLNGELALNGDRLLIANVPEARVLASPDLKFRLDDRPHRVTGEVTIPEACIRPADTAGAVLVSSDERIVTPGTGPGVEERFEVTSDVPSRSATRSRSRLSGSRLRSRAPSARARNPRGHDRHRRIRS